MTYDSWQGKEIILYSKSSRLSVGPTDLPIQWEIGALDPRVKRLQRESDHLYQ